MDLNLDPTIIPAEARALFTAPPAPRWCADLLADRSLRPVTARSRVKPQPESGPTSTSTSCALIAETLNTDTTFRGWLCFYRPGRRTSSLAANHAVDAKGSKVVDKSGSSDPDTETDIRNGPSTTSRSSPPSAPPRTQGHDQDQFLILFSLGSSMDSHAGVCHGGILAVMFDEVMGTLAAVTHPEPKLPRKNHTSQSASQSGSGEDWTAIYTVSITVRFRKPLSTPGFVLGRSWVDKEKTGGRKVCMKAVLEEGEGGAVFADAEGVYVFGLKSRMTSSGHDDGGGDGGVRGRDSKL